jgi:hypothetical protein
MAVMAYHGVMKRKKANENENVMCGEIRKRNMKES